MSSMTEPNSGQEVESLAEPEHSTKGAVGVQAAHGRERNQRWMCLTRRAAGWDGGSGPRDGPTRAHDVETRPGRAMVGRASMSVRPLQPRMEHEHPSGRPSTG